MIHQSISHAKVSTFLKRNRLFLIKFLYRQELKKVPVIQGPYPQSWHMFPNVNGKEAENMSNNTSNNNMYSRPAAPSLTNRNSAQDTNPAFDQEMRNNEQMNLLSNKVGALKSLTLDIEREVSDQNRFLGGMTSDFDRTGGILGNTMNRLQRVIKTQDTRYTFYMMIVILLFFLVIYWLFKRS